MQTQFIVAKFIGKDRSLDYQTGEFYALLVANHGSWFKFWNGWKIEIKRIDNTGDCCYRDEKALLKNWEMANGKYEIRVVGLGGGKNEKKR